MRERVTFVHPPGGGIPPEALEVQDVGLLGPPTETSREDRLTVPLEELPSELAELLQDFEELHLRWTSPLKYDTLEPFSSRLSPGFQVAYTPLRKGSHDP